MSLFDSIVSQAQAKFNLGNKAKSLLSAILALMTNNASGGGLRGFLENFNRAGLGNVSSSWVNSGANMPLSSEQLESALGADTVNDIAVQTGLDSQTATSATAFMIPHIVNNLTPNGEMPDENDLLAQIGGYQNGVNDGTPSAIVAEEAAIAGTTTASQTFDRVGTAASEFNDVGTRPLINRAGGALNRNDDLDDAPLDDNSPLRWLLPLVLLGLLVALGSWFCGKSEPVATTTNVNANKTNANISAAVNSNASDATEQMMTTNTNAAAH